MLLSVLLQATAAAVGVSKLGAAIGAGLAVIGAGLGIGNANITNTIPNATNIQNNRPLSGNSNDISCNLE